MENRTKIETKEQTAIFYEAVMVRPNGTKIVETKKTLEDLQSWINLLLRDGYILRSADKVERVQVKLIA